MQYLYPYAVDRFREKRFSPGSDAEALVWSVRQLKSLRGLDRSEALPKIYSDPPEDFEAVVFYS
jgi:hypothetical protein